MSSATIMRKKGERQKAKFPFPFAFILSSPYVLYDLYLRGEREV